MQPAIRPACQLNVEVRAGAGVCPEFWNISGLVEKVNENQLPVSGVTVRLSGHIEAMEITSMSGRYEFFDLPVIKRDYVLRPEKTTNVPNGATTFDLVLISRHILGVEALGTPYKIIAADAHSFRHRSDFGFDTDSPGYFGSGSGISRQYLVAVHSLRF